MVRRIRRLDKENKCKLHLFLQQRCRTREVHGIQPTSTRLSEIRQLQGRFPLSTTAPLAWFVLLATGLLVWSGSPTDSTGGERTLTSYPPLPLHGGCFRLPLVRFFHLASCFFFSLGCSSCFSDSLAMMLVQPPRTVRNRGLYGPHLSPSDEIHRSTNGPSSDAHRRHLVVLRAPSCTRIRIARASIAVLYWSVSLPGS